MATITTPTYTNEKEAKSFGVAKTPLTIKFKVVPLRLNPSPALYISYS
jgi:hypothetical protein